MRRGSRWFEMAAALALAAAPAGGASADDLPTKRQAELRHLLDHDCGSCHGLTRRGGLGLPLSAEALADRDDDFLIDTILFGRPGTPMPPWNSELTRADARWIVDRLRRR